jgi:hypothetical protein
MRFREGKMNKKVLTLIFCVSLLVLFSGCGSNNQNSSSNGQTGAIAFTLSWGAGLPSEKVLQSPAVAKDICTNNQIDTINASAVSAGTTVTGSWPCSAHSGTIPNVPAGTYTVTIDGLTGTTDLWHGQVTGITVVAGQTANAGTIRMVYIQSSNVPRFAYVTNYAINSASTYAVDAATGRLKFVGKVAAGASPVVVAVDPSGKYAYVANIASNTVSQYTIGPSGALTPMTAPTVATMASPIVVTVDPSGKYAYVTNNLSNTVSQYTIGANGALTPMTPATVAAGSGSWFIITVGSYQ